MGVGSLGTSQATLKTPHMISEVYPRGEADLDQVVQVSVNSGAIEPAGHEFLREVSVAQRRGRGFEAPEYLDARHGSPQAGIADQRLEARCAIFSGFFWGHSS